MSDYTLRVALRHSFQAPFKPRAVIREAQELGITEWGRIKAVLIGCLLLGAAWTALQFERSGFFYGIYSWIFWRATLADITFFVAVWAAFYLLIAAASIVFLLPTRRSVSIFELRTASAYFLLQSGILNILCYTVIFVVFLIPVSVRFSFHGYTSSEWADTLRVLSDGSLLLLAKFAYLVVFASEALRLPTHVCFVGILMAYGVFSALTNYVLQDFAWRIDTLSYF